MQIETGGKNGPVGFENQRGAADQLAPTYRDVELMDAHEQIDGAPIRVRTAPYRNSAVNNPSEKIILRNLLRNQER